MHRTGLLYARRASGSICQVYVAHSSDRGSIFTPRTLSYRANAASLATLPFDLLLAGIGGDRAIDAADENTSAYRTPDSLGAALRGRRHR